jgi:hypothetical protein
MTLAYWTIDLGRPYNDVVQGTIIAAFVLLAIGLPPLLEARARPGRIVAAHELGVLVWLIFAAGIAAVFVRWRQPLVGIVTMLRLGVAGVGLHYLWSNRRAFRRR